MYHGGGDDDDDDDDDDDNDRQKQPKSDTPRPSMTTVSRTGGTSGGPAGASFAIQMSLIRTAMKVPLASSIWHPFISDILASS
jgi:hypothetical protein